MRIERSRLKDDGARRLQIIDEARVGGEEDIRGSAVLDLLGQVARGAHDQGHARTRSLLEDRLDLPEGHVEIGSCIDGDGWGHGLSPRA